MLDKLAGRLKWERTGTGIRVEIPARREGSVAFLLLWLFSWTCLGSWIAQSASQPARLDIFAFKLDLLWLVFWVFAGCWVLAGILLPLVTTTMMELDASALKTVLVVAGYTLRRRTIAPSDVRNLRCQSPRGWVRTKRSGIRFEARGRTINIGGELSQAEAIAVIEKMVEVYPMPALPLPNEPALVFPELSS